MRMKYRYGKKVIVTGASSGIGEACTRLFSHAGYDVVAVSRSVSPHEEEHGGSIIYHCPMDVTRPETYAVLLPHVADAGIVVHCAGFGIAGAAEDTPLEMVRQQMEINYFGVLSLNSFLLPYLRARERGLILVMGSIAGRISIPFQSHYSSTKFALEAYVEALRIETAGYGIRASVIEPGDTKTGFTSNRIWNDRPSVYQAACRAAVERMERDEQRGKSPETAARAALKLSQKKNPPIRTAVGWDYKLLMQLKKLLPARLIESIVRILY